ncbi:class I SAM-dependent DNA methyltransferase [Paramaledivibacter caminithermalis]|jgi:ubiquinone/menaquinone biosynthesis C-methylase UbiE|uniref:Methyltransferase domain-containing protein n=1 Tax=Paramaledivibacter caminithermalis (strain DSM 15212 / CIP 107654 / DViRD3) TaxID=1121301 RepID=A0A1M6PZ99_PARC5|nr:class I SAM-dependent methyltransferase [Paramaledivibacter caminithermalis]SHK13217.1 Methyltransferase domain-containing protein [Paramaledivibacter caminithermalis DSM 15212]
MEAYTGFAEVYDFLMKDVDYIGWVDYIEEIFGMEGVKPQSILELACGTGNITNKLAKRGYDVVGVDISSDMLTFAKNKAHDTGVFVKYLNQDMRELDYNKKVDTVLCLCDGFNYILEKDDLLSIFKKIYSLLKEKGLFVFDISSYYKLSEILGNNVYAESFEDISYIWENYFDEETSICQLDLTIFKRKDKLFERYKEIHYQRAYKIEEIFHILKNAGFNNICGYKAFTFEEFEFDHERVNFVCKK